MTDESAENNSKSHDKEKLKKKIEGKTKTNFGISSCPLPLFEEFKKICEEEFSDTYHLALRYMVDLYKGNKEVSNIWDVIHRLHERVTELENNEAAVPVPEILEHDKQETERPAIVTFGKKEE